MKKITIILLCCISFLLLSCNDESTDSNKKEESIDEVKVLNSSEPSEETVEDSDNNHQEQQETVLDLSKGFRYRIDNKCGFLDKNGNIVTDAVFEDIGVFGENGLAPVKIGDMWGYIDTKGEIVIEPIFRLAESFDSNGHAVVSYNGSEHGMIDKNGQLVVEPIWHKIYPFDENGIARVGIRTEKYYYGYTNDYYYGLIDQSGKQILEPTYKFIEEFSKNGLAVCLNENDEYGYINTSGEEVVSPAYNRCEAYGEQKIALVKPFEKDRASFFINEKGEAVTDEIYNSSTPTKNGLIIVNEVDIYEDYRGRLQYQNIGFGIIDQEGNTVIDTKYSAIYEFNNGMFILETSISYGAQQEKFYQFANENGEIFTDTFTEIPYTLYSWGGQNDYDFSKYPIPVEKGGKWGYINDKGEAVTDFKFTSASLFTEDGMARTYEEINYVEKCAYINTKGEYVIEPTYSHISDFSKSGLASIPQTVGYESKVGFINKKGELVIDAMYDSAKVFSSFDLLFYGDDSGNYGLIDKDNNKITEPIFSDFDLVLNGNIIRSKQDKTYTFYDKNGNKISDYIFTYKDELGPYNNSEYLLVKANEKYGIIGSNGKLIVEPIYDEINLTYEY